MQRVHDAQQQHNTAPKHHAQPSPHGYSVLRTETRRQRPSALHRPHKSPRRLVEVFLSSLALSETRNRTSDLKHMGAQVLSPVVRWRECRPAGYAHNVPLAPDLWAGVRVPTSCCYLLIVRYDLVPSHFVFFFRVFSVARVHPTRRG